MLTTLFSTKLKTLLQQQWIILSGVSFILLEICFGSLKNCICLQRTFCKNLLFLPSFQKKKSVTETLYATKCTKKSPCCANIPKQICIGTYRMIRMDGKNFRLLKSKSDALKRKDLTHFSKKHRSVKVLKFLPIHLDHLVLGTRNDKYVFRISARHF